MNKLNINVNNTNRPGYLVTFYGQKPGTIKITDLWIEHDNYYFDKKGLQDKPISLIEGENWTIHIPVEQNGKGQEKLMEFRPLLIYDFAGDSGTNRYATQLNGVLNFKGS